MNAETVLADLKDYLEIRVRLAYDPKVQEAYQDTLQAIADLENDIAGPDSTPTTEGG